MVEIKLPGLKNLAGRVRAGLASGKGAGKAPKPVNTRAGLASDENANRRTAAAPTVTKSARGSAGADPSTFARPVTSKGVDPSTFARPVAAPGETRAQRQQRMAAARSAAEGRKG